MRKRDRDVSKLEPKALERMFVADTEGDNGYLVYVPKTRKVVAVRDVIIKESEVVSILTTQRHPTCLMTGHSNWGSGTQMMVINTMATKRSLAHLQQ